MHQRPEKNRPLTIRAPLVGVGYCLAGIAAAVGAYAVGGWVSIPIWIVAVLLFVAGLWTALFMGFLLWTVSLAKRKARG
jgi:hypothetical protein